MSLARLVTALAVAGCFTPATPAERPRALAYDAIVIAASAASIALGYELARAAAGSSTAAVGVGYVGMFGGGLAVLGGLAGLVMTELGYVATH